MVSKGREKVRDIAFSKVSKIGQSGYSPYLTAQEFLAIVQEHTIGCGMSRFFALRRKRAGIGGRGVFWWEWTKAFNTSYQDWLKRNGKA